MGRVVTGAIVAFLRVSTLSLAFVGEVIADKKAGIVVGGMYVSASMADADGVEGAVLDLGRDDLHCVAKWFGFLHCWQIFPYALHWVIRSLLFSPCFGSPQHMHLMDLFLA